MNRKKRIIILLIFGGIVAGALSLYILDNPSSEYVFETVRVKKGTVSISITATGTLEATNTVVVGTQVSGVIEKLYVDFNSEVKKGQLIAELDKSTLRSTLETAEADLDKAQAECDYQEANYSRMKVLFDEKVIAQSDFDLVEYNYKLSKANLKSAQANLDKAERNLSYAMIYSPIDGVILNRAVEEGQTVTASMSTPELFTIVNDLSVMQVEANVDEADIGMAEKGQRVEFTVDAFSEETFDGMVSEVRLQPNESSNVITYTVIIKVENPQLKLKPGMTASITDYVQEAKDVLIVPAKAVRFTPGQEISAKYKIQKEELDDTHKMVWVKEGDYIRPLVIEVGIDDGSYIEVISGLEEGNMLVTSFELTSNSSITGSDQDADEQKSPFIQEGQGRPKGGGPGGPPR